jgi:hypothetical protein
VHRCLDRGNVDIRHGHHRSESPLGGFAALGRGFGQCPAVLTTS